MKLKTTEQRLRELHRKIAAKLDKSPALRKAVAAALKAMELTPEMPPKEAKKPERQARIG
jgi:hypothetical protein